MTTSTTKSTRFPYGVMAACAVVAFAAFAVPMYVIRPFRVQGARELAVALVVRQWGPALALLAGALSLVAALGLWLNAARWRTRVSAVGLTLFTLLFSALSQVNIYELMFHPVGELRLLAAAGAPVEKDDMVISVTEHGESHAYPIRTMGYHHIANDWVGGVPVAATY